MDIHSLSIVEIRPEAYRMSAMIAGRDVWYEIEGLSDEPRFSYDPFVLAALFTAMHRGEELHVAGDGAVSAPLIENLAKASHIGSQWWPTLSGGAVRATRVEEVIGPRNQNVGSFFSGGVDSLYTFSRNREEITHLILCWGLDIADREVERWNKTRAHAAEFAASQGTRLVTVRTNIKEALRFPKPGDNHGALLASTGLPFGFGKLLIPATNPLSRLLPYGSHPLLDPVFSNGQSLIVHDSPVRRSVKVEDISRTGIGLDSLRVCNRAADYNCGTCEKCLRTRAALGMLGVGSPALPPLERSVELRSLRLHKAIEHDYWLDNLELANRLGKSDFVAEIERLLRRWRTREILRELDADWFGGRILKLKRWLRPG